MSVPAKARLAKEDWIAAGFQALCRKGPQGVAVEPLAKALKVTKGSFYWHFKDRAALVAAMLDFWEVQATHRIVETVEAKGGSTRARLAHLIDLSLKAAPARYGGRNAEPALRGWAASDRKIARAVLRVETHRLGYLRSLFEEAGFDPAPAEARARLLLLATIGGQAVRAMTGDAKSPLQSPTLSADLLRLLDLPG